MHDIHYDDEYDGGRSINEEEEKEFFGPGIKENYVKQMAQILSEPESVSRPSTPPMRDYPRSGPMFFSEPLPSTTSSSPAVSTLVAPPIHHPKAILPSAPRIPSSISAPRMPAPSAPRIPSSISAPAPYPSLRSSYSISPSIVKADSDVGNMYLKEKLEKSEKAQKNLERELNDERYAHMKERQLRQIYEYDNDKYDRLFRLGVDLIPSYYSYIEKKKIEDALKKYIRTQLLMNITENELEKAINNIVNNTDILKLLENGAVSNNSNVSKQTPKTRKSRKSKNSKTSQPSKIRKSRTSQKSKISRSSPQTRKSRTSRSSQNSKSSKTKTKNKIHK